MAAVHCVIVSFSSKDFDRQKIIFDGDKKIVVENINPYLLDGENILIQSRSKPLCDVPKMFLGNKPADGKNLILSEIEREIFIKEEPKSEKFIKEYVSADDFLRGKHRYCLWLVDCTLDEVIEMPLVAERVMAVKKFRDKSSSSFTTDDKLYFNSQHEFRKSPLCANGFCFAGNCRE